MAHKIAYSTITGNEIKAYQDQRDPSIYHLPANSTFSSPPEYNIETQILKFDTGNWEVLDKPTPEPEPTPEPIPDPISISTSSNNNNETENIPIELPEPATHLRRMRDYKLSESDWRMTIDYVGTDQEEWKTYRQALRDLPSTSTPSWDETGDYPELVGVVWPTPPD